MKNLSKIFVSVFCTLGLLVFSVDVALGDTGSRATYTGVSAIWILANFSYAGMRAQGHPSMPWRIVALVFGFPGTILSYLVIREGGERVYGVDLPKKDRSAESESI